MLHHVRLRQIKYLAAVTSNIISSWEEYVISSQARESTESLASKMSCIWFLIIKIITNNYAYDMSLFFTSKEGLDGTGRREAIPWQWQNNFRCISDDWCGNPGYRPGLIFEGGRGWWRRPSARYISILLGAICVRKVTSQGLCWQPWNLQFFAECNIFKS